MNIMDKIGVLECDNPEGFLFIVVNVLHMVLEGSPVISTHDFTQAKPKIFLKVFEAFFSTNWVSISAQLVLLIPNPKIFHSYVHWNPKGIPVPVKLICHLLVEQK